ncbi:hypothetical protein ACFR9U_00790 [Halorientalis brevis]|uniref:Uncharacterized protein n=1 Tax=Halorientalis brevis TaxID=1126241 RepID=A0ABD6C6M8_9EURY|nr:hypothetical protein [Halorientalis brevis]
MQGKLDLPDAVISPFFVLSSAIAMGLINFELMGFDLASTALEFTSDGYVSTVTYAGIISLLALLIAYATNRRDFSGMGFVELWVVVATVGLVIAPPFVPVLSGLLSNKFAGLIAVVIQAGGYYSLSYVG